MNRSLIQAKKYKGKGGWLEYSGRYPVIVVVMVAIVMQAIELAVFNLPVTFLI